MLRVIILTIFQCLLLACGQVCFKLAVDKIDKFQWSLAYFTALLSNLWLYVCGVLLISATILWGYILKKFDFSIAYPVTAVAYIFGMLAAAFIFHESVPITRWIGVGLVIIGVLFIAK